MKNFAIIGVGGYIAPRHLKAIKDTGNRLVAALDTNDSVGILDRFFYEASFFTEFERFDRFAEKLRRQGDLSRIDYVSICSPNYLHDAHIRFALRIGADAVCEKPLVLNPWNLDALKEMEIETGRKVNTVLQLRLHPSLMDLKKQLDAEPAGEKHTVTLTYITSRGNWYMTSWKSVQERSGGVATNIGIHFFDLLLWLFGPVIESQTHYVDQKRTGGVFELERARVKWFLSIDRADIPAEVALSGQTTFRSISVDSKEIEFSEGFTDLHTSVYEEILAERGFGIEDARPSIELAHKIREAEVTGVTEESHPALLALRG